MNGIENCLVHGTKILMGNLSMKNIEDIVIGDIVIDAFGKETKVINTFAHEIELSSN